MKRLLLTLLILPIAAMAADHSWDPSAVPTMDCDTFDGGVAAGDTVTIVAGTHSGAKVIRDCHGTSGNPITVRNSTGGRAIFQRTDVHSGGFILTLTNVSEFVLDGTIAWSGSPSGGGCPPPEASLDVPDDSKISCGIKVTHAAAASPSTFLMLRGTTTKVTIKGVEIDGQWPALTTNGICIQMNDTNVEDGLWREDVLIEDFYVHDCEGEGVYLGHNENSSGGDDRDLRNIEVRNGWIRDTGWDCVQVKSTIEGTNSIHDVTCVDGGKRTDASAGQHFAFNYFEGGGWFYNLRAVRAGEAGISCITQNRNDGTGPFPCKAWNSVIVDPGVTGPQDGDCVSVGRGSDEDFVVEIENITCVGAEARGVDVGSAVAAAGYVRGIIACDNASDDINVPGNITTSNNLTGVCDSADYVSLAGRDMHLVSGAAAIDTLTANFPDDDLDGNSRPQPVGGSADQGAYEFTGAGGAVSITGKPAAYTLDTGETHFPAQLWVMNEGSGTTLTGEGSDATDWTLTISGAAWGTDTLHGDKLTFVESESDYAEVTGLTLSGVQTACVVARVNGLPATLGEALIAFADASAALTYGRMHTTTSLGQLQLAAQLAGDTSTTNSGPPDVTDNEWRMLCMRLSDTVLDFSVNGAAWDAQAHSRAGMMAVLDVFSIGRRGNSTPEGYADLEAIAAFVYHGSKTNAEIAAIWNGGNLWPAIGVDAAAGGEPLQPAMNQTYMEASQ